MITVLYYNRKRITKDQKIHSAIIAGLDHLQSKKICQMIITLYDAIIQTRLKYCTGFASKNLFPINRLRTISENSNCSLMKKLSFRKTTCIPLHGNQTLAKSLLHEATNLFRLTHQMRTAESGRDQFK